MPRRPLRFHIFWIAVILVVVPAGLLQGRAQNGVSLTPGPGTQTASGTPAPGYLNAQAFKVGPRNLFIDCVGLGAPTIVLETGFSEPGSAMDFLQTELAKTHLTCTYDRAGLGRSDDAPEPRVASGVVADLHTLLQAASVPAPYLLAGNSAGGSFVQLYARTYPGEVVGVVAMNPVPPAQEWLAQALPLMDTWEGSEEEAAYRGEGQSESVDWYESSNQLATAPPPPNVPFEMLISTSAQCLKPGDACNRTYPVYVAIERQVAAGWPQGNLTVLEVGPDIHINAMPDVLAAIRRVEEAAAPVIPATPVT